MKRIFALSTVVILAIAGWAAYQAVAQQPRQSLARLMPQNAVLFLEAQNLGAMLKQWNASPEKLAWWKSDSREVFSRSRLFTRLQQAQDEFASAAGIPPDMSFLSDVAGEQSALAIYDIGKLQLLYITRLPSARAMTSGIWQQRAKFETRQVAGRTFYVRTDPQSERVTAFAFDDDYLILATREDLVAGALSVLADQKAASLSQQGWFVDALATAKNPGELRMVIHLAEVTTTPQFRTYWVQQNITDMRQYESSVTDLFRSSDAYREERSLLIKNAPDTAQAEAASDVADLMLLVPPDSGFYRAALVSSPEDALTLLEQKILTPRLGPTPASKLAPAVQMSEQTVGSQSNLDTRIDTPPSSFADDKPSDEALKALIRNANVHAALQLHRSQASDDGVFVRLHSTVVLKNATDWDEAAVQRAIQRLITPGLTTADIGTSWKKSGTGTQTYSAIDGLVRVALAARGKYLFVSNDPETLLAAISQLSQSVSSQPAIYYAGFDHSRERQNFYDLTALIERPTRTNVFGDEREPEFFSDNIASVSKALAGVKSQSVVARREGRTERQTVLYQWAQ
jgi:hypothetical protein